MPPDLVVSREGSKSMSDTGDSKGERQEQSLSLGQSLNLRPIQPSERIHSTTSAFSTPHTEKGTRLQSRLRPAS